jgi:hypothetical protein
MIWFDRPDASRYGNRRCERSAAGLVYPNFGTHIGSHSFSYLDDLLIYSQISNLYLPIDQL